MVWFQNRRSKERRMKQLRFGGYRPIRRSKTSARDELCVPQGDVYSHGGNSDGFYGQLPLSFFCDGYGSTGPDGTPPTALPHPSFIMPSEAQPVHVDQSNSDNTFLEESLRPPHSSPNMPLAAQVCHFLYLIRFFISIESSSDLNISVQFLFRLKYFGTIHVPTKTFPDMSY
uniref:Homeobox domain-containing protein n=1 Tax=Elaeophora elaphi TaxID=1147741 RepID=A0A0R3RKV6_9BILA